MGSHLGVPCRSRRARGILPVMKSLYYSNVVATTSSVLCNQCKSVQNEMTRLQRDSAIAPRRFRPARGTLTGVLSKLVAQSIC